MAFRDGVRRLVAITFLLSSLAATAHAGEWPTGVGGNAARNSQSDEIGPDGPDILWEGSRPAIVAQQAVIGEGLVIAPRIGSFTIPTGTWIVAHDLVTGDEAWAVRLPYDFPGTSWRSRVTAVRDGLVYATRAGNTNEDYLYALDPADGSIVWRSVDLIDEGTTESPTFAPDGDPIFSGRGALLRINKEDGTTVWNVPRSCPTSSGCSASAYGDRVYIWEQSPQGPEVSAFDVETGARLYDTGSVAGGLVQQLGLFVGPDGTVYAPRTQNNVQTDFLVAYTDTGSAFVEKWRVPLGYVPFASFGIGPDGSVYSYTRNFEIIRLDPDTGAILDTSVPLINDITFSARIAIDALGRLYVTNGGFDNGRLYSFDADLTLRWSQAVPRVNVGGPAMGPGGILVVCGTGTVVRAYQTPRTNVLPTSFDVIFGAYQSGDVTDLHASDDAYLRVEQRPAFTPLLPLIRIDVHGHAAGDTASALTTTLEAAASAQPSRPPQRLSLFDYDASAFEQIDQRPATLGDSVVEVTIDVNASRFIQNGTNALRMRIEYFDPGNVFFPAWGVRIDQAVWEVTP